MGCKEDRGQDGPAAQADRPSLGHSPFAALAEKLGQLHLASRQSFTSFSSSNRRLILWLIIGHLLWSCAVLGLWWGGQLIEVTTPWWAVAFIAVQPFAEPNRSCRPCCYNRNHAIASLSFLGRSQPPLSIWLINQLTPPSAWQPLLTVDQVVPAAVGSKLSPGPLWAAMSNARGRLSIGLHRNVPGHLTSWIGGPTAGFSRQIQHYYLAPEGPPPLIDMFLIKLVLPGAGGPAPIFGISDWIMVVFFAIVARRHAINDNLVEPADAATTGGIGATFCRCQCCVRSHAIVPAGNLVDGPGLAT
ncbi:MAG: hypothetical protein R2864_08080 [Syntrophotaleaceae bacterium]